MSFLEGPKARFSTIAPILEATSATHASHHLKPGCVQCGSLLEISDRRIISFSGKCFSCEHWISDEDEDFEDFEE